MKVCSVCNEIVAAGQSCARSDCPIQEPSTAADPSAKVEPGFTGRTGRAVQSGLDKTADAARLSTRRLVFIAAAIFVLILAVVAVNFKKVSRPDGVVRREAALPQTTFDTDARKTSDFEDLNRKALSVGRRCFAGGDEPACTEFDKIFSNLSTYEQKGIPFCNLEVTRYVSYSVPCSYEQKYFHVFTGGVFGTSD